MTNSNIESLSPAAVGGFEGGRPPSGEAVEVEIKL